MKALTVKQKQYLKGLAHSLEPVVMIGDKGVTSPILKEIDINLTAHELIKVRVLGDNRELRLNMLEVILDRVDQVQLVQHIGKLFIFYRPMKKPKIILPITKNKPVL